MSPGTLLKIVAPAIAMSLWLAFPTSARDGRPADMAAPVLIDVFPPGVAAGGRETWTFRGRNLARVERIDVEGGGIEVVVKETTGRTIVAEARADPRATPGFREVRAEGPDGVSNLRILRVDHLAQTPEREPNDTPDQATPLPAGAAGVGVLLPQDLDHFRLDARAGDRVTIEVEARRLGVPVLPLVTVMRLNGRALALGRETPGLDGDCRLPFKFPESGTYGIQVRDHIYGGSDGACYRLRVTSEPFATGLFPLGGPPGRPVVVTASGGNLIEPIVQTVPLPDQPGALVTVPPFHAPTGAVLAPGRLVVGDGPERNEPAETGVVDAPATIDPGVTMNGRIDRPGEVDRYRLPVKSGEIVRVAVAAAPLGSRLDSVLTIRDQRGKVVAENDDAEDLSRSRTTSGVASPPASDSALVLKPETDGLLTIEVADRFGQGGPEYAYRLSVGPPRSDFSITVSMGEPSSLTSVGSGQSRGAGIGGFNIARGTEAEVRFQVDFTGRTGPIVARAVNLPSGVSAAPVTVRQPSGPSSATGRLVLKVEPSAPPGPGWLRVIGTATIDPDRPLTLTREAVAIVPVESFPGTTPRRPVTRRMTRFPIRVTGPSGPGSDRRN
jgi:hypothetical protein